MYYVRTSFGELFQEKCPSCLTEIGGWKRSAVSQTRRTTAFQIRISNLRTKWSSSSESLACKSNYGSGEIQVINSSHVSLLFTRQTRLCSNVIKRRNTHYATCFNAVVAVDQPVVDCGAVHPGRINLIDLVAREVY